MAKKKENTEIRFETGSMTLKNDLINIAANKNNGTLTAFLKSELIKIRDSYPLEMRKPKKED